jgi:serine/threonine protein kinase
LGRHHIFHRDIRPANILVNIEPLMAKLSDFAGAAEDDHKDLVAFVRITAMSFLPGWMC